MKHEEEKDIEEKDIEEKDERGSEEEKDIKISTYEVNFPHCIMR